MLPKILGCLRSGDKNRDWVLTQNEWNSDGQLVVAESHNGLPFFFGSQQHDQPIRASGASQDFNAWARVSSSRSTSRSLRWR